MADENLQVLAYYTLSSHSLGREQIPAKYLKKLPSNYHAPVILLGRLARDLKVKGKGFGEYLLLDALYRAYELSKSSLGAMAVVVDPINKVAEDFYRSYGFVLLPDSQKMFLPMNVIKQLKWKKHGLVAIEHKVYSLASTAPPKAKNKMLAPISRAFLRSAAGLLCTSWSSQPSPRSLW